ncbi:hypothetical protein [Kitasatospora griseola]|uniref:hypothetical protein n=1 Tax=Kitasatospora griseola TaxID=2064 RepID=UPI001670E760|nr:hypothetical protein [Kitasatospora griseola]
MTDEQALARFETLPAEVRDRVDGKLRLGRNVEAIKVLLDADEHGAGVGIPQGPAIISARSGAVRPTSAPTS